MNAVIALGAIAALILLVFSMFKDERQKCELCDADPSFVWYPIRWGLVGLLILVFLANTFYWGLGLERYGIGYLKDASAVALGVTYALTLINPEWSLTSVLERFYRSVREWLTQR